MKRGIGVDEENFKMYLGQQLRKYRKQKLLTIEETAWRVGMDDKHLGRVERGEKDTTTTNLFKLVRLLDIPSDFFEELKKYNS